MEIVKYNHHLGHIDGISHRFHAFSKLKHAQIKQLSRLKWTDLHNSRIFYHIQAAFFGKSGYGKSTTVNAFFGNSIMKTSDVVACTKECNCLDFELSPNCYLSLADFSGIGESEYNDKKYLKMYRDFLLLSTVVIYVIRADTRDYAIDESVYQTVFATQSHKQKVIFALNCCDKIEPISRNYSSEPSTEQKRNIAKKIDSVNNIFKPFYDIVPYSAETNWNMNGLAEAMVKVILNSKDVIIY